MNHSDSLAELAPALVAAQKALKNPHVDSKAKVPTKTGGSYEYKYLSLPALLEHVEGVFGKHDLAIMQEVTEAQRGIGVTTRILHRSGEWLDLGPLVLPAGGTPQEHGSAVTYARRYALAAAVGLAADEDDDASSAQRAAHTPPSGTAGSGRSSPSQPPPRAGGTAPDPATTSTGAGSRETTSSGGATSTGGADGLLGEGASGSSGGDIHRPCGGVFLPSESKAGYVACSKCSTLKKVAA